MITLNLVLKSFGFFVLLKYGPKWVRQLFLSLVARWNKRLKMDKGKEEESKPQATTAVNTAEEEQRRVGTNAQNVEGAASLGTRAAAAAIISSPSTSTSNSTSTNDTATNFARFQNALSSCAQEFRALGGWIGHQIEEFMETVNVPKMFKMFNELSPLKKILVVILVLAFVWLLRFLAWEGVAYVWPHILSFIHSAEGQSFLNTATDFLQNLSESRVMTSFVSIFATASGSGTSENSAAAATPSSEQPCFSTTEWDLLQSTASFPIISLIQIFFRWMGTNVMNKQS